MKPTDAGTVAVLAGGVGAARFLRGLFAAIAPERVTAIVNTGDDTELHGLAISPDLDTIVYTLAGRDRPRSGLGAGRRVVAGDGLRSTAMPSPARGIDVRHRPGSGSATATSRPTCIAPRDSARAPRRPR